MSIELAFSKTTSYEKLYDFSMKVEPEISFWGARYIVAKGYAGSLDIDSITQRTFELFDKNQEFNELERIYGKKISKRIDTIYCKSDEMSETCNLFTKILLFFRSFSCYTRARTIWQREEGNCIFESYTRSQFNKMFGYPIEEAKRNGVHVEELFYMPNVWRICHI